jgi:hypothetical protein
MKLKLLLPIVCVFAASSVITASPSEEDFDPELWEAVPASEYTHAVGTLRRNLADDYNTEQELQKRDRWMYNNHVGSWYSGHDLQNPACYPNKAPHIRDDMKIAAIKDHSKCFVCADVYITKKHPKRSDLILRSVKGKTTVKIIDYCAGCGTTGRQKVNDSHLDLSIGAFTDLAKKSDGEVPISWKARRCFKSNDWPKTPGKNY